MQQNLMLASSSQSRQQQLRQFTSKYVALSPHIDERKKPTESIDDYVERLSDEKAFSAMRNYMNRNESHRQCLNVDSTPVQDTPYWLVIAGDQTAYIKEKDEDLGNLPLLGKPLSEDAACDQLEQVSGRTVIFLSGVSVTQFVTKQAPLKQVRLENNTPSAEASATKANGDTSPPLDAFDCLNRSYHCVTTKVRFKSLSAQRIRSYVQKDMPLHCAGSFKLESMGMLLFDSVESQDPSALLGLPMISTLSFLERFGFDLL